MNEILFLVIDDDNHADPNYHLRRTTQAALDLARKLSDRSQRYYGDMAMYSQSCDGKDGWWFCESGEECWHVSVREVSLQ